MVATIQTTDGYEYSLVTYSSNVLLFAYLKSFFFTILSVFFFVIQKNDHICDKKTVIRSKIIFFIHCLLMLIQANFAPLTVLSR